MKRLPSVLAAGLLWLALTLVLLELGVAALVAAGRIPLTRPSYALENVSAVWHTDRDPVFGVWHLPNASYRHRKACFDVVYHTNSHGARDRERSREHSGPRVVVLGDSMVEGFGVERHERLTDLLEVKTGVPHLNFGTSGNFGPTQYMLLYESFASGFDHSGVLVGLLPSNDFDDDDLEHGKIAHDDRYRPYLAGTYPDYEIVYWQPELGEPRRQEPLTLEGVLRQFSYTWGAWRYVRALRRAQEARRAAGAEPESVAYEGYSPVQLDRLRYALERIVARAGARPVLVFSIPRRDTFALAAERGSLRLTAELAALGDEVGFRYLDLLAPMAREPEDSVFHTCDGHWSVRGNRVAAEVIAGAAGFYAEVREAAPRPAQASSKM